MTEGEANYSRVLASGWCCGGRRNHGESVELGPRFRRKWGSVNSRVLWGDKPVLTRAG